MARAKTDKPATLSIDVESFLRTRDSLRLHRAKATSPFTPSPPLKHLPDTEAEQNLKLSTNDHSQKVVTGLATLQDAIQTLSSAYIKHTNAVLGEHGAGIDIESSLSKLGDNPLLGGMGLQRAVTPAAPLAAGADAALKKERKKRQHDPNAPKRPLTPYFLYMQTARPIIAGDLGPDAAKGAVSEEGTRRWGTMSADDKQLWHSAYKDNLRLYNARMHSYRAGNQNAKDMTDQAAAAYADEHGIGAEATADAQLAEEANASNAAAAEEDEEQQPEEPAPKTPKSKRASTAKGAKPIVPASIVPPAASKNATPSVKETPATDKKRKRVSRADAAAEKEETPKTADKSSKPSRKKKSKSD
ncbi:putative high mobility group protein 1 [Xylogone sp. PMI_703]|nr:putative high mobility group protein 1 [Xylogone sp. PMI_703]